MPMKWELTVEQSIDRFNLADNAAELDEIGLTIVPPEKTLMPTASVTHARDALLTLVPQGD